jgi:hypothetical protein
VDANPLVLFRLLLLCENATKGGLLRKKTDQVLLTPTSQDD